MVGSPRGSLLRGRHGTWEVLSPPSMNPVLGSPAKTPGLWALRLASAVAKHTARRYREAKETKRRGRSGRKSERFTVPKKRENHGRNRCVDTLFETRIAGEAHRTTITPRNAAA